MIYVIKTDGDKSNIRRVLKILSNRGYVWASGESLGNKILFDPEYILVGEENNKIYWFNGESQILHKLEVISARLFIYLAKTKVEKLECGTPVMVIADTSHHGFKIGSVAIVLDDAGNGDIYAMGFVNSKKGACEKYMSDNDYEVLEYE